MRWESINGYDWCFVEAPDSTQFVSLTLGYGLIHEPLTQFGTLQKLMGMLQAELSRPTETATGRVSVPEVFVYVGSDTTALAVHGEPETLSGAWQRLARVFSGDQALDDATPALVNINGSPRDLTSRFGLSSLTLGALSTVGSIETATVGDAAQLLRRLDPASGSVRAVMCTSVEALLGAGFSAPAAASQASEPSYLRDSSGRGTLPSPPSHVFCSVVVPRTADGESAVRVLARQAAQHVATVTRRDDGVSVSLVPVGPDMFATVFTSRVLTPEQRTQAHALFVSRAVPDRHIEDAVAWSAEHRSVNRALERRALGLSDDTDATVDGTRDALARAQMHLRLETEPGSQAPAGFEPAIPELASPRGRKFRSRAGGDSLIVGDHVLEHFRRGVGQAPSVTERVDLDRLALVIDDKTDATVLVDDQYRNVMLAHGTFRGERQLLQLIEQRIGDVPRIGARGAADPGPVRARMQARRKRTLWIVLSPVIVIAFAVAMSFIDDFIQ